MNAKGKACTTFLLKLEPVHLNPSVLDEIAIQFLIKLLI